jgi:hypothetical protein
MYWFCIKQVRLYKLVKVTDNIKDTTLQQNLSIIHKLWIHNVL